MNYRVEQQDSPRDAFGNYKYRIYQNNVLVAHYRHDYRGDEHGIDFINGQSETWPVGRMIDSSKAAAPSQLCSPSVPRHTFKKGSPRC